MIVINKFRYFISFRITSILFQKTIIENQNLIIVYFFVLFFYCINTVKLNDAEGNKS